MGKVRTRALGIGLSDRERAFDVDFSGLDDPVELKVDTLSFMSVVTIAIHNGNNACAFQASVGRQDGEVVLGQPSHGANCLPAVKDDKTGFYVTFQKADNGAYNLLKPQPSISHNGEDA